VAAIKNVKKRLLFAVKGALVDLKSKSESVKKWGVKIWFRTPHTDKSRRHVRLAKVAQSSH